MPTENTPLVGDTKTEGPSLRAVISRSIVFKFVNYGFLAFADMANFVLLPLVYSTSLQFGGLGLDPYPIGVIMTISGLTNAAVQACLLGPLIRRYGARSVYVVAFSCICGSFVLYPVMSFLARRAGGVDGFVVACIALQLSIQTMPLLAYGA